jgi:hypothetical protein
MRERGKVKRIDWLGRSVTIKGGNARRHGAAA